MSKANDMTAAEIERLAKELAAARQAVADADANAAAARTTLGDLEKQYTRAGQSFVESFHKAPKRPNEK